MKLPRTLRLSSRSIGQRATGRQVSPDVVLPSAVYLDSCSSLSAMDQDSLSSWGHAVDIVDHMNSKWWGPLLSGGTASSSQQSTPRISSQQQRSQSGGYALREEDRQHSGRLYRQHPSFQSDGSSAGTAGGGRTQRAARAGGPQQLVQQEQPQPSGLPQPTPAVNMPSAQHHHKSEAEAVQDLPGIGTWAGRYRLFGRRRSLDRQLAEECSQARGGAPQGGALQLQAECCSPPLTPPGLVAAAGGGRGEPSPWNDSEDARETAWRWRFSRKWEAEQHRFYGGGGGGGDGDAGCGLQAGTSYVSNDELEALEYTQACGVGQSMQFLNSAGRIVRSGSGAFGGALHRATSGLEVDASLFSLGGLSEEVSPGNTAHGGQNGSAHGGLRRGGSGSAHGGHGATAGVMRMALRARDLLAKQEEIEEAAAAIWEEGPLASGAWVGRDLAPVAIDQWGRFSYVVIRVTDGPAQHQKFLVRGRHSQTQAAAIEEVQRQVATLRRKQQLPPVVVEVVGRGVMEWREDTGRHLLISSEMGPPAGGVFPPALSGGSPTKAPMLDLGGLAACLVRQALPCHFTVTTATDAARSSSAALSAVAQRG